MIHGSLIAQTPAPVPPATQKMKSFVLIFRQGAKPLSDDQRKEISAQMPAWASQRTEGGRKFEPRILAPVPSQILTHGETSAPPGERPVTALLFIEATEFQEAVRIAESHPGLRYGVSIEVREWAAPGSAPAQPASR